MSLNTTKREIKDMLSTPILKTSNTESKTNTNNNSVNESGNILGAGGNGSATSDPFGASGNGNPVSDPFGTSGNSNPVYDFFGAGGSSFGNNSFEVKKININSSEGKTIFANILENKIDINEEYVKINDKEVTITIEEGILIIPFTDKNIPQILCKIIEIKDKKIESLNNIIKNKNYLIKKMKYHYSNRIEDLNLDFEEEKKFNDVRKKISGKRNSLKLEQSSKRRRIMQQDIRMTELEVLEDLK